MLRTDQHARRYILNLADSTGKLAIWRLRLMELDFKLVHRAEIKHEAADALFRLPTNGSHRTMLGNDITIMAVT